MSSNKKNKGEACGAEGRLKWRKDITGRMNKKNGRHTDGQILKPYLKINKLATNTRTTNQKTYVPKYVRIQKRTKIWMNLLNRFQTILFSQVWILDRHHMRWDVLVPASLIRGFFSRFAKFQYDLWVSSRALTLIRLEVVSRFRGFLKFEIILFKLKRFISFVPDVSGRPRTTTLTNTYTAQ